MKLVALAVLAAALVVPSAGAKSTAGKLVGTVGPGYTITLTQGGKKVSKLPAGAYVITIADKAGDHNFHLAGPGLNKKTSVGGKGTFAWTVMLKKGKYTYVCDPHAAFMKGAFSVT